MKNLYGESLWRIFIKRKDAEEREEKRSEKISRVDQSSEGAGSALQRQRGSMAKSLRYGLHTSLCDFTRLTLSRMLVQASLWWISLW